MYDHVIANFGEHYKVTNGNFLCPDDGIYAFSVSAQTKDPDTPWNQPVPLGLGTIADPAFGEFDPAVNPQFTDEDGYYAWDVARGCWYVTVEAAGYNRLVSPMVGVPPEVTDLNLSLAPAVIEPSGIDIYLPLIRR